jgi:hypothetical protein
MVERYVAATPEVFELLSFAVQYLDEGKPSYGNDLVKSEFGSGGRDQRTRRWRFTFFPVNVPERWEFELDEDEVRLLGEDDGDLDGTEIQVVAQPCEKRTKSGPGPAVRSADEPLGVRMLERLLEAESIELASKAKIDVVALTIETAVYAALDNDALGDDERAEHIAEAITACVGVEELFASDEDLLALVRELDDA